MTQNFRKNNPWSGWSKEKPGFKQRTVMFKICGKKTTKYSKTVEAIKPRSTFFSRTVLSSWNSLTITKNPNNSNAMIYRISTRGPLAAPYETNNRSVKNVGSKFDVKRIFQTALWQ